MLARNIHIRAALWRMSPKSTRARPSGYNALFELCEDALFLECAEGRMGFCARGEGAVGGGARGSSVDGCL